MDERDLKALMTLQAVARAGSFAAAARELGTTRAAISRVIAEAEQRIGVRLCHRTTRRVALTEAAATMLADAAPHLQALQAAWATLPDRPGRYQGNIRLSCSHAFGRAFVLPVIERYRALHPAVRFELRLSDVIDDLVSRSLDVALRIGPLPDSTMVARGLGRIDVLLVGSPALVNRGPRPPKTLDDIDQWPAVAFQAPGSGQRRAWTLGRGREQTQHEASQVSVQVDSIEGLVDLVRAGVGIGMVPRYLVADDLAHGRLVPVLPRLPFIGPEVHVCYAHRELVPLRTRALIDMLCEAVRPVLVQLG